MWQTSFLILLFLLRAADRRSFLSHMMVLAHVLVHFQKCCGPNIDLSFFCALGGFLPQQDQAPGVDGTAIAVRGIVLSRGSRSSSVDAARHPNHRLSSAFACELVPQALLAASQTVPCAAFDGLLRRILQRKISDMSSCKYVRYVSLHRLTLSVTLRKARSDLRTYTVHTSARIFKGHLVARWRNAVVVPCSALAKALRPLINFPT